jgi:prepilin peptidase CpaA
MRVTTFNTVILIFLLIFSVYFDLKERRIPNTLTVPVILWAILSFTLDNGFNGFIFSFSGLILGFAVFFIPFIIGGMGAGDVKLMAAIGSLTGWVFTLKSTLLIGISGGLIVILYTIYKGELLEVLRNIIGLAIKPIVSFLYRMTGNQKILKVYEQIIVKETMIFKTYIPYGVAIAIGTFMMLIVNYKGITF